MCSGYVAVSDSLNVFFSLDNENKPFGCVNRIMMRSSRFLCSINNVFFKLLFSVEAFL